MSSNAWRLTDIKTTSNCFSFAVYLLLIIFAACYLSPTLVFADDNTSKTDQVNITVPVSCTLDGTGMDSHTANIQNRNYETEIGSTTLTAYCNDVGGFSIYAIGYSNEEYGNTNMIGVNTEELIPTGTTLDGSVSNWAMKLETNNEATYPIALQNGYNAYKAVPSTYTLVAKRESSTDTGTSAIGSVLTSTYAISVSPSQVADTYVGKVRYTLVHPYDAAAPEIPVSIADAEYLQEVNSCPADLPEEQVYTLKDKRDEQEYKVAKLKDGKCWMLDNLALDPSNETVAATMNESNTNASNDAIYNYLNGGSTTLGWSNTPVRNNTSAEFYSYSAPLINNAYKNALVTSYGLASIDNQAKIGIYYNYCAATVGTYCYSGNGLDIPDTLIDATQDVCPANWRMPSGNPDGDYYMLWSLYGQDALNGNSLQYNLSTPLSGYYVGYSASYQNNYGLWWSSTFSDDSGMYTLSVSGNSAGWGIYVRGNGLPVRCLMNS